MKQKREKMLKGLMTSTNLVTRTVAQIAIVAMAGTVGVTVASTAASANLDAVATNTTPQTIQSGTLSLITAANAGSSGFTSTVSSMAPGDTLNYAVGVTTGTMAAQNFYLSINDTATASTLLTTSATKGLTVTVVQCSVAWAMPAGTCSGTTTATTALNTAVSTMNTTTGGGVELTMFTGSVSASTTTYLKFTLTLPASIAETVTNGALPGGTIQGLTASINWKIRTTQRIASVTNG